MKALNSGSYTDNIAIQNWLHISPKLFAALQVEKNGAAISASRVRKLYSERNWPAISALVPAGTLAYLQRHAARHTETI